METTDYVRRWAKGLVCISIAHLQNTDLPERLSCVFPLYDMCEFTHGRQYAALPIAQSVLSTRSTCYKILEKRSWLEEAGVGTSCGYKNDPSIENNVRMCTVVKVAGQKRSFHTHALDFLGVKPAQVYLA